MSPLLPYLLALTARPQNYYDANKSRSTQYGAGRKLAAQNAADAPTREELKKASAEGNKGTLPTKQKVAGDVQAEQAGDEADGFVKIRNPKREEEERKEREEKEKKEREEKAKKEREEKEGKGKEDKEDKGKEGEGDE